jgi:ribonuclease R
VHITELGGEYFRFDEARQELRGERTGIRYAIGSRLNVQVSRVDLDGRRIDFRLVEDGVERLVRSSREKGAARDERGSSRESSEKGDAPRRSRAPLTRAAVPAIKKPKDSVKMASPRKTAGRPRRRG